MLHLVWLAAIAHMRGRGSNFRTDSSERWRDIHDIYDALGWPAYPMGLR